jgi:hypothetical protein
MNASNAKDYLPLVQALAEGKQIQLNYNGDWKNISDMDPMFPANFYRIKPEPRDIWVNRYPNGMENGIFNTEHAAKLHRANDTAVQILYREVIE